MIISKQITMWEETKLPADREYHYSIEVLKSTIKEKLIAEHGIEYSEKFTLLYNKHPSADKKIPQSIIKVISKFANNFVSAFEARDREKGILLIEEIKLPDCPEMEFKGSTLNELMLIYDRIAAAKMTSIIKTVDVATSDMKKLAGEAGFSNNYKRDLSTCYTEAKREISTTIEQLTVIYNNILTKYEQGFNGAISADEVKETLLALFSLPKFESVPIKGGWNVIEGTVGDEF